MERIHLTSLGPISEADITFGDMTVFVGEQASGKSLLLQLVKLILDAEPIVRTLKTHGFDWHKKPAEFLYLYFGEGMESTWSDATQVAVDEQEFALEKVFARKSRRKAESVYLIPAQRVVTLKDGWPRCFTDYASGAPYAVKRFSEQLRLLLDMDFGRGDRLIFPQSRFLNQTIRNAVGESVFGGGPSQIGPGGTAETHRSGCCGQLFTVYGLVFGTARVYAVVDGALLLNACERRGEQKSAQLGCH